MYGSHRYTYAPTRENLSLKTDDIPGARPHPKFSKNSEHYHQRLYHQGYPYDNVSPGKNEYPTTLVNDVRMSQPLQLSGNGLNSQRARSMSRERMSPMQRIGGPILADAQYGQRVAERAGGKKHFPQKMHGMTEIKKENIFVHKESLNLATHDIPGANPGSLISKVVKNHDIAQKIRLSNNVQADALDHFKDRYIKAKDPLDDPFWKEYEQHQQTQLDKLDSLIQAKEKDTQDEPPRYLRASTLQQESSLGAKNNENPYGSLDYSPEKNSRQNQAFNDERQCQFDDEQPFQMKNDQKDTLQDFAEQHYSQKEREDLDKAYENLYKGYTPDSKELLGNSYIGEKAGGENSKLPDPIADKPSDYPLGQSFQKFYQNQITERPTQQEKIQPQNHSMDINLRGRLLDQQYQDMKKIYSYNIIANQPQLKYAPQGARLSNSIKNSYSFEPPADIGSSQPNYNLNSNLLGSSPDKGYTRRTNRDAMGDILGNRSVDIISRRPY